MDSADVVELCVLLQCLGFTVKSLDTSDANASQDDGGVGKTVVVNCHSSGLQVVMESASTTCSCPLSKENSGFWQVSGMAGGKQLDKESGSTLLCTLPKTQREQIASDLLNIVKRCKEANVPDVPTNKSNSMVELKTPEKALFEVKVETPTRYRSLDTLTAGKVAQAIPAPGLLQRHLDPSCEVSDEAFKRLYDFRRKCAEDKAPTLWRLRQEVFDGGIKPQGLFFKESNDKDNNNPIQGPHTTVLDGLIAAEKTAENLRNDLSAIIRQIMDDRCNESSMSSLVLDVSKISVLKGIEATKSQFASSPNLSGQDDFKNSRLRRMDSVSTSNLGKTTPNLPSKISRLRKLSPNIFGSKKDGPNVKSENTKIQDRSGKLNNLFKAKVVKPVQSPKLTTDINANVSASKKKYSHIKSTIPRPMTRKE